LHEEKTIVLASFRLFDITGYGRCIYGDSENVAYGELRDGRILRDARGAAYRITSVPRANSDRNFLDQLSIGLQLPIYSQSVRYIFAYAWEVSSHARIVLYITYNRFTP